MHLSNFESKNKECAPAFLPNIHITLIFLKNKKLLENKSRSFNAGGGT